MFNYFSNKKKTKKLEEQREAYLTDVYRKEIFEELDKMSAKQLRGLMGSGMRIDLTDSGCRWGVGLCGTYTPKRTDNLIDFKRAK